jgi:hypothetical protein
VGSHKRDEAFTAAAADAPALAADVVPVALVEAVAVVAAAVAAGEGAGVDTTEGATEAAPDEVSTPLRVLK